MSTDLSSPIKKESAKTLTASAFADEWYLNAYKADALGNKTRSKSLFSKFYLGGWAWRKVVLASMLGVLGGLGIASLQIGQTAPLKPEPATTVRSARSEVKTAAVPQLDVTQAAPAAARVVAPHKEPVGQTSDDVARLKIRNRRLEALVKALRQRPAEKRSVQEPTTYLGQ